MPPAARGVCYATRNTFRLDVYAALAEFVAELPEGLATRVGERGVQLSGGQRQLLAIARGFLKDAPLLVLDEATSHLDTISEAQVRAALDALILDRTTIVVAHRLSTIRVADLILVLERGRVIAAGRHAELLARRVRGGAPIALLRGGGEVRRIGQPMVRGEHVAWPRGAVRERASIWTQGQDH